MGEMKEKYRLGCRAVLLRSPPIPPKKGGRWRGDCGYGAGSPAPTLGILSGRNRIKEEDGYRES